MGLGHYIGAARSLAEEIRDSISWEESDELFQHLQALGMERWLEWKTKHHQTIVRYVASTPAQRAKLKIFQSIRLPLAYASYQHCLSAHVFLQAADSHGIYPGGTYRLTTAAAGNAYREVYDNVDPDLWPWGERHPFVSSTL